MISEGIKPVEIIIQAEAQVGERPVLFEILESRALERAQAEGIDVEIIIFDYARNIIVDKRRLETRQINNQRDRKDYQDRRYSGELGIERCIFRQFLCLWHLPRIDSPAFGMRSRNCAGGAQSHLCRVLGIRHFWGMLKSYIIIPISEVSIMHPILFHIGSLTFYTYGLIMAIGFIVAYFYLLHLAKISGQDVEFYSNMFFWLMIFGILGAKVLYLIVEYKTLASDIKDVVGCLRGGLVWYGGLIADLIFVYYYCKGHKKDYLQVADTLTSPTAVGLAIGRWGCLMAGCCYGKPAACPGPSPIPITRRSLIPWPASRCIPRRFMNRSECSSSPLSATKPSAAPSGRAWRLTCWCSCMPR